MGQDGNSGFLADDISKAIRSIFSVEGCRHSFPIVPNENPPRKAGKGERKSRLFFENEELVANKVPNQRGSSGNELGNIGPELIADTKWSSDESRDTSEDEPIDGDANQRNNEELGELDSGILVGDTSSSLLECPAFIHVVTVDDCYRKRNAVENKQTETARDPSEIHENIEYRKINSCIHTTNDDEFGELLDEASDKSSGN